MANDKELARSLLSRHLQGQAELRAAYVLSPSASMRVMDVRDIERLVMRGLCDAAASKIVERRELYTATDHIPGMDRRYECRAWVLSSQQIAELVVACFNEGLAAREVSL